jgi:voltage-gated potassium channel
LHRFRLLKVIIIALLLLAAAGTVGFHYIEHWSWFDCFYMVITTVTTIGYQEVHPLSHAGRIFNSFLIISGVSLLFVMIGALTQALLEFELVKVFGKRRMERELAGLKNHYIICGLVASGPAWPRNLRANPARL